MHCAFFVKHPIKSHRIRTDLHRNNVSGLLEFSKNVYRTMAAGSGEKFKIMILKHPRESLGFVNYKPVKTVTQFQSVFNQDLKAPLAVEKPGAVENFAHLVQTRNLVPPPWPSSTSSSTMSCESHVT